MMTSAGKKEQQGAALIWLVSLFFIFMMAALVVDSGRLYFEQKQIQSAANSLATRIAEEGQTCSGVAGGIDVSGRAREELNKMIGDGEAPLETSVRYAVLSLIDVPDGENNSAYVVTEVDSPLESNGVSVGLQKDVTGLLSFVVDKPLTAEASVRKELVVGATISSEVLSLDTNESALLGLVFGDVLGQNLTLDGVGLTQLSNALTDVGDLVDAAGLASAVNAVPVDTLLVDVLNASEGITGPAASVVQELVNAAVGNNVSVDDVIQGVNDAEVPPGSKVSTLALVQSIILNIDGALPKNINLNLSDLGGVAGLGGLLSLLADINVDLSITPSPGFFIAAARTDAQGNWPGATSSAITADVSLKTLGLIDVALSLKTAKATVELRAADCVSGNNNMISNINIYGRADLIELSANIEVVGGLLTVDLDTQQRSAGGIDANFSNIDMGNYNDVDPRLFRQFDGSDNTLSTVLGGLLESVDVCALNLNICVLGLLELLLGDIVRDLLIEVTSILSELVDSLLAPLLQALGISLAPSELTLESVGQSYTLIESGI
ncbi:pilus assembly protein TadG-related protein [Alcanivorax sp.]|uniref:pilus assembly protein TadG-related protein n=1 Tax=Alcanivorax sp. TaxID=1872427 RepID=UPI0032D92F7F